MNLVTRWSARCILTVGMGLCALGWPTEAVAEEQEPTTTDADAPTDEAQAANLFALAESAFSARDYERAAHLFLRADEKAPHASVMYNAAVSWDYAGKRAEAADCYQTALERGALNARQQAQAEQRLDALGAHLGLVHVAKPEGGLASVDRIERRIIPFQFFQEPGTYHLQLETQEGARTTTDITVLPGQTLRLELNPLESQTAASPDAPVEPEPLIPVPAPPARNAPIEESPSSTQEVIGWIGIGLGVVAGGAATYWGTQTLQKRDAYRNSGYTDDQARSDGLDLRTRTNIGWVSSAVTTAAGLTLVLTSPTVRF